MEGERVDGQVRMGFCLTLPARVWQGLLARVLRCVPAAATSRAVLDLACHPSTAPAAQLVTPSCSSSNHTCLPALFPAARAQR